MVIEIISVEPMFHQCRRHRTIGPSPRYSDLHFKLSTPVDVEWIPHKWPAWCEDSPWEPTAQMSGSGSWPHYHWASWHQWRFGTAPWHTTGWADQYRSGDTSLGCWSRVSTSSLMRRGRGRRLLRSGSLHRERRFLKTWLLHGARYSLGLCSRPRRCAGQCALLVRLGDSDYAGCIG